MACPLLEKCVFFNDQMAKMPDLAEDLKDLYCRSDYEQCARYQVKQSTGCAHPSLWPNETYKINEAIKELKEQSCPK